MDKGISATVSQLAEDATAISAETIDLPGAISDLVRAAAQQDVDPYIVLGVLVESIAHMVTQAVPEQKKVGTAKGVTHLLLDRFVAHGLIR